MAIVREEEPRPQWVVSIGQSDRGTHIGQVGGAGRLYHHFAIPAPCLSGPFRITLREF